MRIATQDRHEREAMTTVLRHRWTQQRLVTKKHQVDIARKAKLGTNELSYTLSERRSPTSRLLTKEKLERLALALGLSKVSFAREWKAYLAAHAPLPFSQDEMPGVAVPATGPGLILRFASLAIG